MTNTRVLTVLRNEQDPPLTRESARTMTTQMKTQIDLQLILPDVHDPADQCIARLISLLTGRLGIDRVHITDPENGKANLCVHYRPEVLSVQRLRELVDAAGAQLTSTYSHLVLRAGAPLHARAARTLEASLRRLPGVFEANVAVSGAVSI